MKRYFLSPVLGTGTSDDPYRPKAQQYGSVSAVIATGADGRPRLAWALCVVAAPSLTLPLADAELTAFPDAGGLDVLWGSINKQQRDRLIARLTQLGVSTAGITNQSPFRDLLRVVGRFLDPAFDEEAFDVSE